MAGYGAALPAGSYGGPLGNYRQRHMPDPANSGAALRDNVKRTALSGVGLGGLCDDPAAVAARAVVGAAGTIIGSISSGDATGLAAAQALCYGNLCPPTSGAGGISLSTGFGTGFTAFADAWGAACVPQTQAQASGSVSNTAAFDRQRAEERAYNERMIASSRETNEQVLSFLMMQQRQAGVRAGERTGAIDTSTLFIGGGVIVGVIALALLLRR